MKFGKTITSHQVPEWSLYYMNYKDLKKQIKLIVKLQNAVISTIVEEDEDQNDDDQKPLDPITAADSLNNTDVKIALAGFFFSLDRNIEKVDDFFSKQYSEYDRRLRKMTSIVNSVQTQVEDLDNEEVEEIIGVLVELRSHFRNLKWYGELNKRGFVKILKKLDKKTGTMQQIAYLNSRIYPLGFANELDIVKALSMINDYLNKVAPRVNDPNSGRDALSSGTSKNRSPSAQPDKFSKIINSDDPDALFKQLIAEYRSLVLVPLKLLISLLNKAALIQAENCINKILELIPTLGDPTDIAGRNFFHHHVIALGKQVQKREELVRKLNDPPILEFDSMHISPATPPDVNYRLVGAFGPDGINSNDSPTSLLQILNVLPPHLRPSLLQRDQYKRNPLHYAAQFGLREITTIIIDFLKSWNAWDSTIPIDDLQFWGDAESLSPLHLAVLGTHPKTVEVLISNCNKTLASSKIVLLAARLNSPKIMKELLGCNNVDINYTDSDHNNETPLYIASKLNFPESVSFLLENDADTEIGEASYGWTPMFISAVEGLYNIVQLLKDAGAEYSIPDDSGWRPMEHACLRGHLKIADMLKPDDYENLQEIASKPMSTSPSSDRSRAVSPVPSGDFYSHSNSSIDRVSQKKGDILKSIKPKQSKAPQPVKSFGHRYLQDESLIVVTLGSNDMRNSSLAVKLDRVPISKVHSTELDTALSLVISTRGQFDESPTVIDLPLDDIEPITLKSTKANPLEEILLFDIVPTYGGQNKKVLGRAVAMLDKIYPKVGNNRAALFKMATLPIIETETLDVLGSINFEVLIVTPFTHPNMRLDRTETYWKSLVSTRVIGHRGLGKNTVATKSLQLGENTVESFIAAASLGASYVEFDVQLTKDHVPVVYHDFLVAESGIDIPMHELTSEQFLHLNEVATTSVSKDDDFLLRPRSASYLNHTHPSQMDKMKLTRTFKSTGFKGNSRGSSIASSFVTLAELFKKIPKNVGFNIECKYPLLHEAQEEDLPEITFDLNFWIDTVLKVVYDHADGRDVIFSSFHPEACLMLSLKQPALPILFLTESGTTFMPDVRCTSLQSAVRFAKRWNLLGIVSAAEPLVKCPRLAQVVKSSGLVCFTYGTLNNDPVNAKLQMEAGIDAVIVDNVLAVRTELTKDAKKNPSEVVPI